MTSVVSSAAALELAVQLVAAVLARSAPVLVVEAAVDALAPNTGTTSPSLRWSPSLRRRRPCSSWRWRRWWGTGVLVVGRVVGEAAEGVDDAVGEDTEGVDDAAILQLEDVIVGGDLILRHVLVVAADNDVEAQLGVVEAQLVVPDEADAVDVADSVGDALDEHLVARHRRVPRRR